MQEILNFDNVDIWCETLGSSDNETILLISGAMAHATFWDDDFCNNLSEEYFVIRFDNRDYGYSTHFEELDPPPYSIMDMVDDVKHILDHYGKNKANIVGHSLGGSIAQLFGVTYPQYTLSITPISSPIIAIGNNCYIDTPDEILSEMWEVLMSNPCHKEYDQGLDGFLTSFRYLHGDVEMNMDMAKSYIRRIYDTEPIIRPHQNHTNIQRNIPDIYELLRNAEYPVTLIHGNKDYLPANPYNVKILAESLPNAQLFELEGAGHMFFNKTIWKTLYKIIKTTSIS